MIKKLHILITLVSMTNLWKVFNLKTKQPNKNTYNNYKKNYLKLNF